MKEYNNFPKEVKEKIIAQRDRYVEYEKLAYEQGLRYTPQYYEGWVNALNWLME